MTDTNPKTAFGRLKPSLHAIPPVAIISMGLAMSEGEACYGLTNWRSRQISTSVYYDAIERHLMAWWDGEECSPFEDGVDLAGNPIIKGGIPHLAHVMACCAILIDAEMMGVLIDDRPPVAGPTAAFIADLTAKRKAAVIEAQRQRDEQLADALAARVVESRRAEDQHEAGDQLGR